MSNAKLQDINYNICKMIRYKILFFLTFIPFSIFSQSLNTNYEEGIKSFKSGNYENAIIQFSEAEKENFKTADLYFKRAMCFTVLKKYSEALNDYNKTLELEYNSDALYFRALVKVDLEQYEDAVNDLNTLYKKDETYNKALLKIGDIYYKNKNFKKAIEFYEKFLNTEPDNHYALNQLGYSYGCLDTKKDLMKGIEIISKAIDLDKSNYFYYYCRGYLYYDLNLYKKGNLEMALNDFENTIKLNPNYSKAYFEIGNIYYDTKNYQKQIEYYSKAIDLEKENGKYYFWRAKAYLETNYKEKACADFQKAKELNYEVPEIYELLCNLKGTIIIITK